MATKKAVTPTPYKTMCMFCGGHNGQHKDASCKLKGAAMSALMASLSPVEAMLIADKTPFLSELAKRLNNNVQDELLKRLKELRSVINNAGDQPIDRRVWQTALDLSARTIEKAEGGK